MRDIDFDELDRAVNSLMTNVSKSEPPKDEDHIKTLDITPTLAPNATPEFTLLNTSSTPQNPTPPSGDVKTSSPAPSLSSRPVSASVASRRGGRFMDVVHPSSDMKPRPATSISRQGVTITPEQTDLVSPSPEPVVSPVSASVPKSTVPAVPAAEQEHISPVNEWPDPLDMVDFDQPVSKKTDSTDVAVIPKSEEPTIEVPELPSKKNDVEPPLTTPFLTGTKVEKRPLGGGISSSVDEPDHAPVHTSDLLNTGSVNDPNDQLPALPKDVEPILPAELQNDLMAVEADNGVDTHIPDREPSTSADSKLDKEDVAVPSKPVASKSEASVVSNGPTSIPQQYREEPSTGDTVSGAIYDTDTYHQPLSHPVKKKSGWLWVVWILLIVLVGAGIGAALFFFGVV